MRISQATGRQHRPPYNAVYVSFQPEFDKLFEERHFVSVEDGNLTYVEMPQAELEIKSFAEAKTWDIGLVVGDTGIGKTSVLRRIIHNEWSSMDCMVLAADLSTKKFAADYPRNFVKLAEADRFVVAAGAAQGILSSLIKDALDDFLTSCAEEFLKFISMHRKGLLPAETLFRKRKAETTLSAIAKKHPHDILQLGLYFYAAKNDIRHLKVIIDNVDDKDRYLISELCDSLGHLQQLVRELSQAERGRDTQKPIRIVTPIIACRPATAAALIRLQESPSGGVHGLHELRISEPCDIGKALVKRYEHLFAILSVSHRRSREVTIGHNAAIWQIRDRDDFFAQLCKILDAENHAKRVLELCNNNVAHAMRELLNVLRNNRFLDLAALLGQILGKGASDQPPINWPRLVRALAYGNQGSTSPVYPVENTCVVNILAGRYAGFGDTTLKPRIIGLYTHTEAQQGRTILNTLQTLCDYAARWFNITEEDALATIDEMHLEGLLLHSDGAAMPSDIGPSCEMRLSPRAKCLWAELERNDILLGCYRDDLDLDEDLRWRGRQCVWDAKPTTRLSLEGVARELVWLVRQMWQGECSELDVIAAKGEYRTFCRAFGSKTVTERVVKALSKSRYALYENIEGFDYEEFPKHISEIDEEVHARSQLWLIWSRKHSGNYKGHEYVDDMRRLISDCEGTQTCEEAEQLLRDWETELLRQPDG